MNQCVQTPVLKADESRDSEKMILTWTLHPVRADDSGLSQKSQPGCPAPSPRSKSSLEVSVKGRGGHCPQVCLGELGGSEETIYPSAWETQTLVTTGVQ